MYKYVYIYIYAFVSRSVIPRTCCPFFVFPWFPLQPQCLPLQSPNISEQWQISAPVDYCTSIYSMGDLQDPKMKVLTVPYKAIFCGDIPLHRPYIGLIYGRYLQFGFLKWPLIYPTSSYIHRTWCPVQELNGSRPRHGRNGRRCQRHRRQRSCPVFGWRKNDSNKKG